MKHWEDLEGRLHRRGMGPLWAWSRTKVKMEVTGLQLKAEQPGGDTKRLQYGTAQNRGRSDPSGDGSAGTRRTVAASRRGGCRSTSCEHGACAGAAPGTYRKAAAEEEEERGVGLGDGMWPGASCSKGCRPAGPRGARHVPYSGRGGAGQQWKAAHRATYEPGSRRG